MDTTSQNSELLQLILNRIEELDTKMKRHFESTEPTNECLTLDQTCNKLGVSKRTLQKYRDNGMISFSQVRGKIYFRKQDLNEFMDRHRVKAFSRKGGKTSGYGYNQNTS
jgi:excisionase family DNA binding protein